MPEIRVLLVSVAYAPGRIASDKQFVNDLIANLPSHVKLAIWAIAEIPSGSRTVRIGHRDVPMAVASRFCHAVPSTDDPTTLPPHPQHRPLRQLLELSSTCVFESFRSLASLVREFRPDVIHFTDHVGPVLPLLRLRFPGIAFSFAKPSARIPGSKGWLAYRALMRASYGSADGIVAYSDACRCALVEAGLDTNRMISIPWGIQIPKQVNPEVRAGIRQRYGCSEDSLLVVGLPRNSEETLHRSVEIARKISKNGPFRFVFAIRPFRFEEKYAALDSPKVRVVSGPSDFHDLLAAADIAFVLQSRTPETALPFLVWLEAMVRGTPMIARRNPGVLETISDGETGMLFDSPEEVEDIFWALADNRGSLCKMQKAAELFVKTKHSIANIAERYAEWWQQLVLSK